MTTPTHDVEHPNRGGRDEDTDIADVAKEMARRRLFGAAVEARVVRIGRFEVISELGRGGMGRVFLAKDPVLGRRVAIKVLHEPHGVTNRAQDRLVREAAAMAAIRHPNTVPVFEVGTVQGRTFVAMEYVEGANLRQWWEATSPTVEQIVARIVDAAQGIHAAHVAGIVHRDIKPENILIGDDGRARVTDFGLARAYASAEEMFDTEPELLSKVSSLGPFASITATGAVMGTPAYMSPEQLALGQATTASDQYALCLTLFEACTGARLHDADDPSALARQMHDQDSREAALKRLPRRLRAPLRKGLSVDPEQRYGRVLDLADAVQRAVRPASATLRRAGRWTAVAGLVAAAGLIAGVIAFASPLTPAGARLAAVARPGQTHGDELGPGPACETLQTTSIWTPSRRRQLKSAFESSGLSYAALSFERLDVEMERYGERLAKLLRDGCADPPGRRCLAWRVRQAEARLDVLLNPKAFSVDSAVSVVRSMEDIEGCMHPGLRPAIATQRPPAIPPFEYADMRGDLARAQALIAGWRHGEAKSLLDKLQTAAEQGDAFGLQSEIEFARARIEHASGRPSAEAEHLARAFAHARAGGLDDLAARAAVEVVLFLQHSGARPERVRGALDVAQQAVNRGGNARVSVKLAMAKGRFELRRGNFERAVQLHRGAVELAQSDFPIPHEDLAYALDYLGGTYAELGRAEQAFEAKRAAIAAMEAAHGPDHAGMEVLYRNTGNIAMLLGRRPAALEAYERRIQIQRSQFGAKHPRGVAANYILAKWWSHEGDFTRAHAYLNEVLDIGKDDPHARYLAHRTYAEMALFEGDLQRAERAIESARAAESELGVQAVTRHQSELLGLQSELALARHQPIAAERYAAKAVELMGLATSDSRELIEPRTRRAAALIASGNLDQAKRELAIIARVMAREVGILPRARLRVLAARAQLAVAQRDVDALSRKAAQLDRELDTAYGKSHPYAKRLRKLGR